MKGTLIGSCLGILAAALVARGEVPQKLKGRPPATARPSATSFRIVEAGIPEMRAAMAAGRLTSHALVSQYLIRLALHDHRLHAVLAVNPHALDEARQLDRERAAGKVRGPLHGVPVALKDNIHTAHLPTTGGALAFAGYVPPYEATLTKNLRDAGAIIVAKTGLTELANWVAGNPTAMPGNYNAVGGFGFNPYDPRPDPREATFDGRPALPTGGSSSGIGTAASFWAANVGTDTGGSVISPSNANMLVGIRPTIGRISRYGVIPITADHDTAGPMTRTVADAAIMLGVLESPSPDPHDPATTTCMPPPGRDYTKFLRTDGLKGARIGVPRAFYYDRITLTGDLPGRPEGIGPTTGITAGRGGLNAEQARVMAEAIAVLKQQGAIVVDPANVPSLAARDPQNNFAAWDFCSGAEHARGKDENCSVAFKYGMKRDFNLWLKSLGASAPVKTLTELRQWNVSHAKAGAIRFGQSRLDISDEMDVEADRARFDADRRKDLALSRANGIDGALKAHQLDAILTPGGAGAGLAARAGYPIIVVPFGMVPNAPSPAFPAGFDARPAPFGVGFTGTACSEPRLIELAYAFEQATKRRVAPRLDD
ncbi:MAG: amidase [Acidobacteria bacterium]|nr:MAG: amidase [Acidobacteriota bacterium]PYR22613.1 MAG: amidase [Acidobacteriota bacterium]PYR53574.1 MAG: amidase [Acidobacteriota bacterium]